MKLFHRLVGPLRRLTASLHGPRSDSSERRMFLWACGGLLNFESMMETIDDRRTSSQ